MGAAMKEVHLLHCHSYQHVYQPPFHDGLLRGEGIEVIDLAGEIRRLVQQDPIPLGEVLQGEESLLLLAHPLGEHLVDPLEGTHRVLERLFHGCLRLG